MQNHSHTSSNRLSKVLPRPTSILVLIVLGGVILVYQRCPRSLLESADTNTGSILGTVVDISDDPVPNANVVVQGPGCDRFTEVTNEYGSFAFHHVTAGVACQITVSAEGFARVDHFRYGPTRAGENFNRRQTPHRSRAAGSYRELFPEGGCRARVKSRRTATHVPLYTKYLCDLRAPSRASYHEDEVPHGIQRSHQSSFLRSDGCVGRRSSRPMTPLSIAKVQEDMASGLGQALPTPPQKACSVMPFCHRSCIRTLAISTRAPVQNGLGLATPSSLHLSVRETMERYSRITPPGAAV